MSQSDIPWQVMTLACRWDWTVVVNNIRGCHAHDIFSHEELSGLPYLPVLSKGWPDLIIYRYVFQQKWSAHIRLSPVTITDMPFSIFLTYRHGTQLPHLLFYFDRFNFSSSFNEVICSSLSLYLTLNPPANGLAIALGIYLILMLMQATAPSIVLHSLLPDLCIVGLCHNHNTNPYDRYF